MTNIGGMLNDSNKVILNDSEVIRSDVYIDLYDDTEYIDSLLCEMREIINLNQDERIVSFLDHLGNLLDSAIYDATGNEDMQEAVYECNFNDNLFKLVKSLHNYSAIIAKHGDEEQLFIILSDLMNYGNKVNIDKLSDFVVPGNNDFKVKLYMVMTKMRSMNMKLYECAAKYIRIASGIFIM